VPVATGRCRGAQFGTRRKSGETCDGRGRRHFDAAVHGGRLISGHRSKSADEYTGQEFEYIFTVCDNAGETCPFFPGRAERIHHSFEDPPAPGAADPDTTMAIFRRVRDGIGAWVREEFIPHASAEALKT
jgi:arsenate reductase